MAENRCNSTPNRVQSVGANSPTKYPTVGDADAMFAERTLAITLAVVMVSSMAFGATLAVAPAVSAEEADEHESYAGTHLSFVTTADALAEYTVEGDQMIGSVEVESASDAEQRGILGVGVDLATVTSLQASALTVQTTSETSVQVESDTGASIEAHDSQRGHLVIHAEGEGQLVTANVSSDAQATQESDSKVVVTKDDGTEGVFIVVGEGSVAVNEAGNVTAELVQDAKLTYQQYDDERDEEDEHREELIANGTAAAEMYVTVDAEAEGEAVAEVVHYGHDTTVDVVTTAENEIHVTAERTESEGRIIITSISEQAYESASELEVMVDGEAATHVESMSELEAAAAGGDNSAYMVRHASTADASAEVLIGVNHFSERDIVMSTDGAETPDDGDGDDDIVEENPGFGAAIAGIAVAIAALIAARRR